MKITGWIRQRLGKDDAYRLAAGVMVREELTGALIYNVNTDQIIEINQDALYLLQLCDGKLTLKEFITVYAGMKELRPGIARVIVRTLFKDLIGRGLVVKVCSL